MLPASERDGLCECGCGRRTSLATITRTARGDVVGLPVRFIVGHANRPHERFRITPGPLPTPCHVATTAVGSRGYAWVYVDEQRKRLAHIVAWEAVNGPVPDGLELDHLCRVRACLNPEHMEAVTHRENSLRGIGPTAINARKTHCLRGHSLEGDNLYPHPDGRRECRTCKRSAGAAYMRRKRAAA